MLKSNDICIDLSPSYEHLATMGMRFLHDGEDVEGVFWIFMPLMVTNVSEEYFVPVFRVEHMFRIVETTNTEC